jgi:UDP-glucose 4-epimerase
MEQPGEDLAQNVVDFHHLLDQLRLSGCATRVIQLSSAAVYGQPDEFPITEATPLRPVSPYGFHKLQAEMVSREFYQIYGLPVCNLRIFSAYGAGLKRQIVWELCRKARLTGQLVLEGTGFEERDFIHGRDVARAARLIAEKGQFDAGAYNIALGISRRVAEVATCIGKLMGLPQEPVFEGKSRPGNPEIWRASPTRLQELGFVPKVSWEEGLKENINWCLSQLGS